jgi:hypothetical protein
MTTRYWGDVSWTSECLAWIRSQPARLGRRPRSHRETAERGLGQGILDPGGTLRASRCGPGRSVRGRARSSHQRHSGPSESRRPPVDPSQPARRRSVLEGGPTGRAWTGHPSPGFGSLRTDLARFPSPSPRRGSSGGDGELLRRSDQARASCRCPGGGCGDQPVRTADRGRGPLGTRAVDLRPGPDPVRPTQVHLCRSLLEVVEVEKRSWRLTVAHPASDCSPTGASRRVRSRPSPKGSGDRVEGVRSPRRRGPVTASKGSEARAEGDR